MQCNRHPDKAWHDVEHPCRGMADSNSGYMSGGRQKGAKLYGMRKKGNRRNSRARAPVFSRIYGRCLSDMKQGRRKVQALQPL